MKRGGTPGVDDGNGRAGGLDVEDLEDSVWALRDMLESRRAGPDGETPPSLDALRAALARAVGSGRGAAR